MKRLALILAAPLALTACDSSGPNEVPITHNMVNTEITLKTIKTGTTPNQALKQARTGNWTYFGEPRIVSYKTNSAGKVISLKLNLGSWWSAYKLKEALTEKFKNQGNKDFRLKCQSERKHIKYGSKTFIVTDEDCYAKDGRQTLHIYSRNPVYKVPEAKYNQFIRAQIDAGKLALYDEGMQTAHKEQERKKLMQRIEDEKKAAAKDL